MQYAWALIFVGLTAALLMEPRLGRLIWGEVDEQSRGHVRALKWFIFVLTCVWLPAAVAFGERLDYGGYQVHWWMVRSGLDPWKPEALNAYGPVYNLLAYPAGIDHMLPKLIFVYAWVAASVCLTGLAVRRGVSRRGTWIVAAFLLLGPFLAVGEPFYGFFDIMPAVLCLAAVALRVRNRDVGAGVLLAIAVLMKYYPLAILPFLMLDGRRLRLRLGVSCVGTIALGMMLSVWAWGTSTFNPLMLAADRPSKHLSILRFLRGDYSPMHLFSDAPDLDHINMAILLIGGGAVWLICYLRRVRVVPAAVIGMMTGVTLYKVGHMQFWIVIVLLIVYWWIADRIDAARHRRLTVATACYLGGLSLYSCAYPILKKFNEPTMETMHELIGLPAFLLSCWLIVEIFVYDRAIRNEPRPLVDSG